LIVDSSLGAKSVRCALSLVVIASFTRNMHIKYAKAPTGVRFVPFHPTLLKLSQTQETGKFKSEQA